MDKQVSSKMLHFLNEELNKALAGYLVFRKGIAKARVKGNEVEEAMKDEDYWENKVGQIKGLINNATVLYPDKQNLVVDIGNRANIQTPKGEMTIILEGVGWPEKNIISVDSPLGKGIIGKKRGDSITLSSGITVIIKEIGYPW